MPEQSIRPTRLELSILRALWQSGGGTVREIHTIVNGSKPTGTTTVLKMLQIMTEKGLVVRAESVRPQVYRSRHPQEQTHPQADHFDGIGSCDRKTDPLESKTDGLTSREAARSPLLSRL
jgi:predicted transcriptional regulator